MASQFKPNGLRESGAIDFSSTPSSALLCEAGDEAADLIVELTQLIR